jgi:hypothetical protein
MKKKVKRYFWTIILLIGLIVFFATGCTAAKKASSSQINVQEERTEQKEQVDLENTIKVTDTTRTEASSTQRIIIEFRDPPPAESPPDPPPGNADQNYYNYMLYLHLINQIKSIEQTSTNTADVRTGLDITGTTQHQTEQSKSTSSQQVDATEESSSDPVDITPTWIKSIRTIGLIILFIAVALLFIRYGGAIRSLFKP